MAESKRVVVTGATGLVGQKLCARLREQGYQVVVFSRNPQKARERVPNAAEYVEWNLNQQGDWVGALYGAYGVIHLAGASIFGQRWTTSYKLELRESRLQSTHMLVDAMAKLDKKPGVFISGSAVGYYGARGDTPLDENAEPGNDFLSALCTEWEQEARKAEDLGIRTVTVRTGIVLDAEGGALEKLKIPFQMYLGGPVLPGTQWFSWVHVDDEVGVILMALQNEKAHGPINATAPNPQTNRDFSETLGKVLGVPVWLPVPGFALQAALGEFADSLTTGQRVLPAKAQELGYEFQYPTSEQALRHLLKS
jgi:hypothetical protein